VGGGVSTLQTITTTGTLENLAAQINTEHRACEAAAVSAVEHAIRCGELLLEAKERSGHGGWLKWLSANCEVSSRHAQRYMQLAKDRGAIDATRVSDLSLRGAMRQLRESKAVARERRRQEWAKEHAELQREYIRRVRAGEIRVPLQMAVSHTYDFEQPPDGWENWGEPLLCLVEERQGVVRYVRQPDWSDDERIWSLSGFELEPGDEEFLARLCPSWQRDLTEADLEASSQLFGWDDEGMVFQPPIRELSWEDGRLCLPTGHLAARLVGNTPWIWWVWDSVAGAEILKAADPELANTHELHVRSFVTKEWHERRRPPKWRDASELEAALLADLEAVRAAQRADNPDLTDPRLVYEIGERVLDEWERRSPAWQRFAAFAQDGEVG
jgi:hypothetical protein